MSALAPLVLGIVLLVVVALWLVRCVRRGRFAIHDRLGAATEALGVVATFALARVGVAWTMLPTVVWLGAVVLAAAGVAALVVRLPSLPVVTQRSRAGRAWRGVRVVAGSVLGLAVVGVSALTWSA